MPYKIEWVQEGRVVHFDVLGDINADELEAACTTLHDQFLAIGQAPVHLILDTRSVDSYPSDLWLVHLATDLYANHRNTGHVVIIGLPNQKSYFFVKTIVKSMKRRAKIVKSLREALVFLDRLNIRAATRV